MDEIRDLLERVERDRHRQDKYRTYENYKQELSQLCGFDSVRCRPQLYQDTLQQIVSILKI